MVETKQQKYQKSLKFMNFYISAQWAKSQKNIKSPIKKNKI